MIAAAPDPSKQARGTTKGGSMSIEQAANGRRDYVPSKIVHTEKIETRAAHCAKAEDTSCGAGSIQG